MSAQDDLNTRERDVLKAILGEYLGDLQIYYQEVQGRGSEEQYLDRDVINERLRLYQKITGEAFPWEWDEEGDIA